MVAGSELVPNLRSRSGNEKDGAKGKDKQKKLAIYSDPPTLSLSLVLSLSTSTNRPPNRHSERSKFLTFAE